MERKIKSKKMNNKGFSLVELLVAVALLAIIVTPVLASFVTSAKINRNSRKMMTATDVGQTIMEGFADKTFLDLVGGADGSVYSKMSGDLTGAYSLATINDGIYNKGVNHTKIDSFSGLSNVKANGVQFNDGSTDKFYSGTNLVAQDYAAQKMISKNFLATALLNDILNSDAGTPKGQELYYYTDSSSKTFFAAYRDIDFGGRHYDAVASVLPCAADENDEYYTCSVVVMVYEKAEKPVDVTEILNGTKSPMIVLTSGLKNQQ